MHCCAPSVLKTMYTHKLSGFVPCGKLVSVPPFYLLNYLYSHDLRIFILYFDITFQYYFILWFNLFRLWPLGALSFASYVPLTEPHQCVCCFLSTFLLSGTTRYFNLILCISCPIGEAAFLQEALVPFAGE